MSPQVTLRIAAPQARLYSQEVEATSKSFIEVIGQRKHVGVLEVHLCGGQ